MGDRKDDAMSYDENEVAGPGEQVVCVLDDGSHAVLEGVTEVRAALMMVEVALDEGLLLGDVLDPHRVREVAIAPETTEQPAQPEKRP